MQTHVQQQLKRPRMNLNFTFDARMYKDQNIQQIIMIDNNLILPLLLNVEDRTESNTVPLVQVYQLVFAYAFHHTPSIPCTA